MADEQGVVTGAVDQCVCLFIGFSHGVNEEMQDEDKEKDEGCQQIVLDVYAAAVVNFVGN